VAGDAHRGVEGKATMLPGEHVVGVLGIEQAAVGDPTHHPAADLLGEGRHSAQRQGRSLAELDSDSFWRLYLRFPDSLFFEPTPANNPCDSNAKERQRAGFRHYIAAAFSVVRSNRAPRIGEITQWSNDKLQSCRCEV
jgi:hypothetical protein